MLVMRGLPAKRINHFSVRKIPRLRMVSNSIREGDDQFNLLEFLCLSNSH